MAGFCWLLASAIPACPKYLMLSRADNLHRWLYSNHLTSLPAELGQLQRLRKLWADSNQLTALPEELGQCSELQVSSVCLYAFHCNHRMCMGRVTLCPTLCAGVLCSTAAAQQMPRSPLTLWGTDCFSFSKAHEQPIDALDVHVLQ